MSLSLYKPAETFKSEVKLHYKQHFWEGDWTIDRNDTIIIKSKTTLCGFITAISPVVVWCDI